MSTAGPSGRPPRRWRGLTRLPLFARCIVIGAAVPVAGGTVFGFIRGLDYLPTLPFAVIEGAILIGLPGSLAATVLAGLITFGHQLHRSQTQPNG